MKEKIAKRHPLIAVILSIAATGLGHLYCGKLTKGLVLFFISFTFAPIIVIGIQTMASTFSLMTVVGAVLILAGVFIYAIVDAFFLARRMRSGVELKAFNRWYIYLLFIVVSVSYPTNLSSNIQSHIIQAYKIPSTSMVPSVLKGDYLLLDKAIYNMQSPERGDAVIFVNPNNRHIDFLKRIVALPGDTVEIKNNVLIVNGVSLEQRPVADQEIAEIENQINGAVVEEINGDARYRIMLSAKSGKRFAKIRVPNGHCFVLGDNRGNSVDSRHFGPVPLRDVMGCVDFIYLPAETWSRFGVFEGE